MSASPKWNIKFVLVVGQVVGLHGALVAKVSDQNPMEISKVFEESTKTRRLSQQPLNWFCIIQPNATPPSQTSNKTAQSKLINTLSSLTAVFD